MRERVSGRALRRGLALAALWPAALVAGCGDNPAPPPDLEIGLAADWGWAATAADQVGYYLYVLVEQRLTGDVCGDLPASLRVTANGQDVPLVLDANSCLDSKLTIGPFLQAPPVVVVVQKDGQMVGQAMATNLMPGAGATLAVPADGSAQAGDAIVVVPPSALPSSEITSGKVFPLEQAPWPGSIYLTDIPERHADGVHATLPAFSGRAAVVLRGSPFVPVPMITCEGFAICTAIATNTLGPVFVTEAM